MLAPGLKNRVGHEHEYTLMAARAAIARGAAVRVFCPPHRENLDLPVCTVVALPARRAPVMGLSLAAKIRRRLERLLDQRDRRRLERLFRREGPSHWLVHTATYPEIAAFAAAFAGHGQGRLSIILRYDHYDDPDAVAQIRDALAPAVDPRIALFADSDSLSRLLAPLAPAEIRLAPIPTPPLSPRLRARAAGFFGSMRRQKGFHRLPALFAAALALDPALRFTVQAYGHPDDLVDPEIGAALAALRTMPAVTLVEHTLDSDAFHEALAACAAVLTPYDAHLYRAGTSGIFTTAMAAGCAVVGSDAGWMSEEAARAGLTRYFAADFDDPEGAARTLVQAVETGLAPFAPTKAEANWITFNSPDRLIEQLDL